MAIKKGFHVDRRVGIAMDALSTRQKAALNPVLRNKEHFIAHARRPGVTKRLSYTKPLYTMKAGAGMRVIFTVQEEMIVVLDVMRKVTMDRFVTKRKSRGYPVKRSAQKASVKRDEARKDQKI